MYSLFFHNIFQLAVAKVISKELMSNAVLVCVDEMVRFASMYKGKQG